MSAEIDISKFIEDFQTNCTRHQIKNFEKNETITTYIKKRNQLCILIDGSADLVRYDQNGNKTIVDHFSNNDIFGEVFYNIATNNELYVEAKSKCKVLFYFYDEIHTKCKASCKFHQTLSSALPDLIIYKIKNLNTRIELLTKRSIREKLIRYFNLLSTINLNKTFELPFSFTDLADYLSVDRSAMMREIKLLVEDGIIEKEKNKITLIIT